MASGLEIGFKIKRQTQINERITRCHAIGLCFVKKSDINSLLAIRWTKTQNATRRPQLGNSGQAPGQCKVVFNTYHIKTWQLQGTVTNNLFSETVHFTDMSIILTISLLINNFALKD